MTSSCVDFGFEKWSQNNPNHEFFMVFFSWKSFRHQKKKNTLNSAGIFTQTQTYFFPPDTSPTFIDSTYSV